MKRDYNNYQKQIFAKIFVLANQLQAVLDQSLKQDHLTTKQLFVMMAIDSFGIESPSYKGIADKVGTSYQNVKVIVDKLQEAGYLHVEESDHDARAKCVKLTEKASYYWSQRDARDALMFDVLFESFDLDSLDAFYTYLQRFEEGIEAIKYFESKGDQ